MTSQKQALYEATDALWTVLPPEVVEAHLEAGTQALLQALDDAGYDVRVESVEELVSDVEALLQTEDLDEGLKDFLGRGLKKVTRALGRTSIGKAVRLNRMAGAQQDKYDDLDTSKAGIVQSAERAKAARDDAARRMGSAKTAQDVETAQGTRDLNRDRVADAKKKYTKAHMKQSALLNKYDVTPESGKKLAATQRSDGRATPLPSGLKLSKSNTKGVIANRAARLFSRMQGLKDPAKAAQAQKRWAGQGEAAAAQKRYAVARAAPAADAAIGR